MEPLLEGLNADGINLNKKDIFCLFSGTRKQPLIDYSIYGAKYIVHGSLARILTTIYNFLFAILFSIFHTTRTFLHCPLPITRPPA